MAVALQSGNLVWQKVKNALSVYQVAGVGCNPATQNALLDLKGYLSQEKRNPNLQFLPIDGVYTASDGGTNASEVLIAGACTIYGIYLKKQGSTETVFKASNNATTAASNGTQDLAIAATAAGDVFVIYPDGRAMSTGFTVTEQTDRTGSTQELLANQMNGFAIVGA